MYYFDLSMGIILSNEEKSDSIKTWAQKYFTQYLGNSDKIEAALDAASNDNIISLEGYSMSNKEGSINLSTQVESGEFAKALVTHFVDDLSSFWISLDDVCMGAGKIEDGILCYKAGNPEGFQENSDCSGMKLTGNANAGFESAFFELFTDGDEMDDAIGNLHDFICDIRYGD